MDTKAQLTTSPNERYFDLLQRRQTNRRRGLDLSWSNANEFISLKKGYPLMVAGVGGVGKTEFLLDLMINSSIMHKWRWLILSPEMGDRDEVFEQLIEKLSKGDVLEKSSEDKDRMPMSDETFDKLVEWCNKYYRVLDPISNWNDRFDNLQLNIRNFFEHVQVEEQRLGGSFDGILIDPFNELDIDWSNIMNSVKDELDVLLAWTKKRNYFTVLTNHVKDKQDLRGSYGNEVYMWTPPAKKEEWAYGQQFGRKGYQMVMMYQWHPNKQREMAEMEDKEMAHSVDNFYNVREFYVQKSKPKGVGKTGKFRLFFDRKSNRYYNYDPLYDMKKGILWPE